MKTNHETWLKEQERDKQTNQNVLGEKVKVKQRGQNLREFGRVFM